MQFSVPQFIDVEDRIIGPLTVRQFGYLMLGGGLIAVAYVYSPSMPVFIIVSFPIAVLAGLLAFYKINGRPFHYYILASFNFLVHPKVRFWRRQVELPKMIMDDRRERMEDKDREKRPLPLSERISPSSLEQLTYLLDTEGNFNRRRRATPRFPSPADNIDLPEMDLG